MSSSVSPRVIDLVTALMDEGCEMWSVGRGYCIGEPTYEPHATNVKRILDRFGPRDHLLEEISAYLAQIGRSFDRPI
jgi:uncharacterized protein (UPF0297 family)